MKYGDKIMKTDYFNDLKSTGNAIAKKYLSHPLECSRKVKGLRIRYRGKSKPGYRRVSSFCHMAYADTFAIYKR